MSQWVRFGSFELDLASGELRKQGRRVHLPPQPAAALCFLVRRSGEIVTREELREALWPDQVVEWDTGLNSCIRAVRAALGDRPQSPRFLETVPRRGYRFVAPVDRPSGRRNWRLLWIGAGAAALAVIALVSPKQAPPNRVAREAFLEGRYLLEQQSADALSRAVAAFQRAVEAEPSYAPAWAGLAEAKLNGPNAHRDAASVRDAIDRALELDPELPDAHLQRARLAMYLEWDWSTAGRSLRRAVKLGPENASVHQALAAYYSVIGQHDAALSAIDRAVELEPVDSRIRGDAGWYRYYAGRAADALAQCQKTLTIEPQNPAAQMCVLRSMLQLGRRREAAEKLASRYGLSADDPEAVLGRYWTSFLHMLQKNPDTCESAANRAIAHTALGQIPEALDALERAVEQGYGWTAPFSLVEPILEPLHGEPRFQMLMARMNLP